MRYQGKNNSKGDKIRWKGTGTILLAALLTACGGESSGESGSMPQEPVRLEDIRQNVSERAGTSDPSQADNEEIPQTEGAEPGRAGTGSSEQGGPETASSARGESGAGSSALADDTSDPAPEAVKEPVVEKLTPEGIGWGLSYGESGTQPTGNAAPWELEQYDAYYLNEGEEKVIYLTFDCGYENGNTEKILDALKAHNAPATFFVVGHFLETEPEIVKRMAEEGHAVGNHTYHHYDVDTLDEAGFQKEMEDVEALFKEITGTELSPYYRPPEGKCGITNLERAQDLGYATCFWSLAYVDWDTNNQPTHQAALDKLTARIHPGAIVLLHNTSNTNGEILDELLTKWEEMGYTFAPLSDLTQK